ncbi:TetR/AcrR family transcriptional regulator [Alcaligenes parafaecalis]|uniref:TetR/AcrR family transcriptional regulator n=2 Tax=Alcaligenes parafaecalis TaxID=171260 RepID=A0ABT3VL10_9BURK|nr:TetR/AcrR family transcriptional regulator [Alcaligenes parafaecalis]MCX5463963.1 TetR/AcrR family transcriptional regulator [Alcaligenes parafaecalis]
MSKSTTEKLQDAAMARFAVQGFDATTMNEIAADVGIKKPSVYAHFRNKDELFMSLIPNIVDDELNHARQVLQGGEGIKQQLRAYLEGIQERFEQSHQVRFWIRTLFAPPVHLYDVVMEPMHVFMEDLERIIHQALAQSALARPETGLSVDTLAMTYMALIDSLQSELLFGGARKYKRRLESVWLVFDKAVFESPKS